MARRPFRSPLTGDVWEDVRPVIGTVVGLANYLNGRRPRRRPPEGFDAAIALATDAAGAFAGVPKIVRPGEIEGRQISDAYWQAKEAKRLLTPYVDDGIFLQNHNYWKGYVETMRELVETGARVEPPPVPTPSTRAARLAWWAAALTEKGASGGIDDLEHSYARDVAEGAVAELDDAGVPREVVVGVERVWRFVVAAGRMPIPGVDDTLVDAFEAAIMADQHDFARHLAKNGWGQGTGDGSSQ
jgi:hypothetical protein